MFVLLWTFDGVKSALLWKKLISKMLLSKEINVLLEGHANIFFKYICIMKRLPKVPSNDLCTTKLQHFDDFDTCIQ